MITINKTSYLFRFTNRKHQTFSMGVYYTCEYCGTTGKGQFYCNCHAKESKKVEKMRRYTTILGSVVRECPGGWVLFEKLFDDSNGEIFYTAFLQRGTFSLVEKADYKNAKREVRRQKDIGRCKCKPYVRCAGCAERSLKIETPNTVSMSTSDVQTDSSLSMEAIPTIFDQEFIHRRNTDENFAILTNEIRDVAITKVAMQRDMNVIMSTCDLGAFLKELGWIISQKDFEATCGWLNTIFLSCGWIYEAGNWDSYKTRVRDLGKISFCEKDLFESYRRIFRDTEFLVDENTGLYVEPK